MWHVGVESRAMDSGGASGDEGIVVSVPPQAILVDLDDTIIEAGRAPAVLLRVAIEQAAALAPHAPAELAVRLDAAFDLFWSDPERANIARFDLPAASRQIVRETFDRLHPALTHEIADRFADRFTATREEMTRCLPGALESLDALRTRGIKLALITNGPSEIQRAKIERFRLGAYFDHIQIEGETGFGKPDEQAYQHAMATLGVGPHETWIVGDHLEWEVAAPQRLGITAVWCDGFGRGLPPDTATTPDFIVASLAEVVALFANSSAAPSLFDTSSNEKCQTGRP
jgi:putative hydrolase of the HAD superfamily